LESKKDGTYLTKFDYTRDLNGNILKVVELGGKSVQYTYDSSNRLILENNSDDGISISQTVSYTYDNVGNRLTRNDSTDGITIYTYDKDNRLLKTLDGSVETSYSYDVEGNLTKKYSDENHYTIYTWNDQGLLSSVKIQNGTQIDNVTYKYDVFGNRISESVNGDETNYLIDFQGRLGQVREAYKPDGTLVSQYNYDVGQLPVSKTSGTQTSYFLGDNLGNTIALADGNGNVTDRYEYDAFGRILLDSNVTQNDYLYGGEQFSRTTGLNYLRARYLDVDTGRFISVDPYKGELKNPVSQHPYMYAGGNPVTYRDPTGNFSLAEFSAADVLKTILEKNNTGTKLYHFHQLKDRIKALENVIWFGSVAFELFGEYLEGFLKTPFGAFSASSPGTGVTGQLHPSPLSKYLVYSRPGEITTSAQAFQAYRNDGLKKVEFLYSLGYTIPMSSNVLQTYSYFGGLNISGFLATEANDANGNFSGTKKKIDYAAGPGYVDLSGSLAQELTLWTDAVSGGKFSKFVAGANIGVGAGYSAVTGFSPAAASNLYLQLSFVDGNVKFKWNILGFKLTLDKGLEAKIGGFKAADVIDVLGPAASALVG
jgi:RHS repeat-associated protein